MTIERVSLPEFLATTGRLLLNERLLIVDQAVALLEQAYVHLPFKQSMYAVRPIQQLRLLQYRLLRTPEDSLPSEFQFHNEITKIFSSLRDLHTVYVLPEPFSNAAAFLPFMIEEFYESEKAKFLVSKVSSQFSHEFFVPGVEILYWNGTPISRVVEINSERTSGSNSEARRARGVMALTNRSMATLLPPDEEWVVITYRSLSGDMLEIRQPWLIMRLEEFPSATREQDPSTSLIQEIASGVDIQTDTIQRLKMALYAPNIARELMDLSSTGSSIDSPDKNPANTVELPASISTHANSLNHVRYDIPSGMPGTFRVQVVVDQADPNRKYGYIRIFTFSVGLTEGDADRFVLEFQRLLLLLPSDGLILDVRGNGGGLIYAAERILQMLTPRRIEPERLEFINTPLTLELCRLNAPSQLNAELDLSPWIKSIAESTETGAVYSSGHPLSSAESCNLIGQQYYGPVILITDALCYSATDIFAAGFQDHQIGPILGISKNTGAGGANVWKQTLLQRLLADSSLNPFKTLPNGTRMQVSIRRSIRVGDRAGTPVEDFGVVPEYRHYMTKNDLLNNNVDLVNRAISILSDMPVRMLSVVVDSISHKVLSATVISQGISRLDVFADQRPPKSIIIRASRITLKVSLPRGSSSVEIHGFEGNQLVAAYRRGIESFNS